MTKSFKGDNPALSFLGGLPTPQEQQERNAQEEQQAQQEQEVHEALHKTQGRKGHKLPRFNMALAQENLDYLRIISRIEGVTMTEYVNRIVAADRERRAATIAAARGIIKGVE